MIQVIEIKKTCESHPAQWEGKTDDGHMVYVRYRWGWLTVSVSPEPSEVISDAVRGVEIYTKQLGDRFSGRMNYEQMRVATRHVISFPDNDGARWEKAA